MEFFLSELNSLALLLSEALSILFLKLGIFIKLKFDLLDIYDGMSNTKVIRVKF